MSDEQKKETAPPSSDRESDAVKKEAEAPAPSGQAAGSAEAEPTTPNEGQSSPEAEKPAPKARPVKADKEEPPKAPAGESAGTGEAAGPAAEGQAAEKEPAAAPAAKAAPTDAEKEAKAKAAAEARAARASARAKKPDAEEDAGPKEPSPNQPRLDRLVQILKHELGEEAVAEAFINERDAHMPYVIVNSGKWFEAAELLRDHEELRLNYLRNVTGIDQETHMEVVYHLLSLHTKQEYCVKVKTDRGAASIPSVTPVWPTANWNEREIYDLLGIDFPGHPDLRRIMMSDDWVGHPLRKDYEPLDPEV